MHFPNFFETLKQYDSQESNHQQDNYTDCNSHHYTEWKSYKIYLSECITLD